ncbi:MAG: hypothetical protein HY759_02855 [Nitrospirae bacterium]|nr:hypothetical protein [Nitrospirota bacterium]
MLSNCWEIRKCGREKGGVNEHILGVCPAYPDNGHSCWIVAGTFCLGEIQGTFAQKETTCLTCEVYKLYSTPFGSQRGQFKKNHPQEFESCVNYPRKYKK